MRKFGHFLRLFWQHVVRYAVRRKILALLNIASIALGVAVFYSILLVNSSALLSFRQSIDIVAGKAHAQITSPEGRFPDEVFPQINQFPGVKHASPVIEVYASLPDYPGEYLRVIGIEPFRNAPFATFEFDEGDASGNDRDRDRLNLQDWLGNPDGIALSRDQAERLQLELGDELRIRVDGQLHQMRVTYLIDTGESYAAANSRIAAMDISWVQQRFSRINEVTSIQVILDDPEETEMFIKRINESDVLPPNVRAETPEMRSSRLQRIVSGFQLNLTAMAMVSLLIGMFLIYSTVSASVLRRRHETGVLRSIGVSRHGIRWLFIGEALLYGVIGTLLGLAGGWLLGGSLVSVVGRTTAAFYGVLNADTLFFQTWPILVAFVAGIVSTLLAAWIPAERGARDQPVEALRGSSTVAGQPWRARRIIGWAFLTAGIAFVMCLVTSFTAVNLGPAWLSFAAAFFVLATIAAISPVLIIWFSRFIARLSHGIRGHYPGFSMLTQMSASNLERSVLRNAVTVGAFAAALGMVISVTSMIFSFRLTVEDWVEQSLVADIYVAPAGNRTVGSRSFLPSSVEDYFRALPEAEEIAPFREYAVLLKGEEVSLVSVSVEGKDLKFVDGKQKEKLQLYEKDGYVIITEPLARRFNLSVGDRIKLPAPTGEIEFEIAGVYYDYTRDQGLISMNRASFVKHWKDDRIFSLGASFSPGTDLEKIVADFRAHFAGTGEFEVYSNRSLRGEVFKVFDRTFAVTYVLRTIAIIVAVTGIVLGLTILVMERQREIGIIRAVGSSRGQVAGIFLLEAIFIGIVAVLLGLPGGLALAKVLTSVIMLSYFGWTIELNLPWLELLFAPLWVITVAALAGLLPARKAARTNIADAVRFE